MPTSCTLCPAASSAAERTHCFPLHPPNIKGSPPCSPCACPRVSRGPGSPSCPGMVTQSVDLRFGCPGKPSPLLPWLLTLIFTKCLGADHAPPSKAAWTHGHMALSLQLLWLFLGCMTRLSAHRDRPSLRAREPSQPLLQAPPSSPEHCWPARHSSGTLPCPRPPTPSPPLLRLLLGFKMGLPQ